MQFQGYDLFRDLLAMSRVIWRQISSGWIRGILCFTIAFNGLTLSAQAALPGLGHLFAGTAPDLGLTDNHLAACPASPNCVLSQDGDPAHSIPPLTYHTDRATAYDNLLKILSIVPRTTIITTTDHYIRVAFESRLMGFVDDGEFYFPEGEYGVIQVRSASRLGESDLGVNRIRIEQIRLALQDLESRQGA